MDRFTTYDFLLMFHSNHGPILYLFRDVQRFQSKIAKFPHPLILCVPLKGFPWNWVPALGSKTRMMRQLCREKKFDDSFGRLDRMHDRQTDRHRATAKTALTHNVAR